MPVDTAGRVFAQSYSAGQTPVDAMATVAPFLVTYANWGGHGPAKSVVDQPIQALTYGDAQNSVNTTQPPVVAKRASYIAVFVSVFALLVILKMAIENEHSQVQPELMGVGVYNLVAVTIMALLGIATTKIVTNKWLKSPIFRPLRDIVNLV